MIFFYFFFSSFGWRSFFSLQTISFDVRLRDETRFHRFKFFQPFSSAEKELRKNTCMTDKQPLLSDKIRPKWNFSTKSTFSFLSVWCFFCLRRETNLIMKEWLMDELDRGNYVMDEKRIFDRFFCNVNDRHLSKCRQQQNVF